MSKSRILSSLTQNRLKIKIQSRFRSVPPLSDIDFKNIMASIWTTLNHDMSSVTCIHNRSNTCSVQALAQQSIRQVSSVSFENSLTGVSKILDFEAQDLQSLTFYSFYFNLYLQFVILKYIFTKIWTRQANKILYQFHNWISSHQILIFQFWKLLI